MAAVAILKNHKIAISPQRFDRFLRNLVSWCKMGLLTSPTVKKIEFYKSKMADGRHFENHKNRNISATVWPSLRNLVPWCKLGLLTIQTVKNWTSKIQDGRQLPFWQEAQLSPRDRAMRCVSWNLANFHATVEKLLVRQVLNKSKL